MNKRKFFVLLAIVFSMACTTIVSARASAYIWDYSVSIKQNTSTKLITYDGIVNAVKNPSAYLSAYIELYELNGSTWDRVDYASKADYNTALCGISSSYQPTAGKKYQVYGYFYVSNAGGGDSREIWSSGFTAN